MHGGWLTAILNLLGMGGGVPGGSAATEPRRICGLSAAYREYTLAAAYRTYDLEAAHREYRLTTEGCECC